MTMPRPYLLSPATALPPRIVTQEEALDYALQTLHDAEPRRVRALYRRSGVRTRSIVVPSTHAQATTGILALGESAPSTGERMNVYEREIVPLATAAARRALVESGVDARSVTHVIVVSCTGFMSPGLDTLLVRELRCAPTVARVIIGFMGCHGAINGLRTADAYASQDPSACVLLVCAELCSLHFAADAQTGPTTGGMVANALFADGAAAMVVGGASIAAEPATGWHLIDSLSAIIPGTEPEMGWRIGDRGFTMTLTTDVPDHIGRVLPGTLEPWLARHALTPADVAWAVHPGGPRILDVVESTLHLTADAMSPSREVLAAHGNMSSPTILFILAALPALASHAVLIAFGPGLAMEAALLRRATAG